MVNGERIKNISNRTDNEPGKIGMKKYTMDELRASGLVTERGMDRLAELGETFSGDDFRFVRDLKRKFGEGIDICLVGGIVRDAILDNKAKDYDFLISFSGSEFKSHEEARKAFEDFFAAREMTNEEGARIMKLPYGKLVLAGESFGVYKLSAGGEAGTVDIAFPRKETAREGGKRGGRANFDVQSDALMPVGEDLSRRDLDINALALRVKEEGAGGYGFELLDAYNGLESIGDRRIRAVGEPIDRFRDDLSRIFRVIRFAVKYDYEIDDRTWQALADIVSEGKLNALDEEGKFLFKRETLAAELCKAVQYDPLRTLRLLRQPIPKEGEETCLLGEIAPALTGEVRLGKKDKQYIDHNHINWYLERFGESKDKKGRPGFQFLAAPDEDEIRASREIKEKSLDRAEKMFALAEKQGIKLRPEESFAVLYHNSGQTARLAQSQPAKDRSIYPNHYALSRAYWNKDYYDLRLGSLPIDARELSVDRRGVGRIIGGIPKVYGVLNDPKWENGGEVSDRTKARLLELFPEGVNDDLFRVMELDIAATSTVGEDTRRRFEGLRGFLQKNIQELEEKFGNLETGFNSVFTSRDLNRVFRIEPGSLYKELGRLAKVTYFNYLREVSGSGGEYMPEEARDRIFARVSGHSEVRRQWQKLLTPSLYRNIFEPDLGDCEKLFAVNGQNGDVITNWEATRREVMTTVEKRVYEDFAGRGCANFSCSGAVKERFEKRGGVFAAVFKHLLLADPAKAEEAVSEDMEKEGKGKVLEDGEIVALADRTGKKKESKPKLFDFILPEITAEYGVSQPANYHSEGDVFTHTFAALKAMKEFEREGKFRADEELAATILLHDTEKPEKMSVNAKTGAILFAGHEDIDPRKIERVLSALGIDEAHAGNIERAIDNHMVVFQRWKNGKEKAGGDLTLDNYRLFPGGTKDILYKLMLCDARASVRANGRDQYEDDHEHFRALEQQLRRIDKIKDAGLDFESFRASGEVGGLLDNENNAKEAFGLFLSFADFAAREKVSGEAAYGEFARKEALGSREVMLRFLKKKYDLKKQAEVFLSGGKRETTQNKKERQTLSRRLVREFLASAVMNEELDRRGGDIFESDINRIFGAWLERQEGLRDKQDENWEKNAGI